VPPHHEGLELPGPHPEEQRESDASRRMNARRTPSPSRDALGARVVLTDMPTVVPHLRANIAASFGPAHGAEPEAKARCAVVTADHLSWGSDCSDRFAKGSFDVIVLADCVYWEHLFDPLLSALLALAEPQTLVLLAQTPRRNKVEKRFFTKLGKRFHVNVVERLKPELDLDERPEAETKDQAKARADASARHAARERLCRADRRRFVHIYSIR